jgi:hypothetical protein
MVSPISSTSAAPVQAASQNARATDGDYKTKGPGRATTKDADGDYKAASVTSVSAQLRSSPAVQAILSNLKLGG